MCIIYITIHDVYLHTSYNVYYLWSLKIVNLIRYFEQCFNNNNMDLVYYVHIYIYYIYIYISYYQKVWFTSTCVYVYTPCINTNRTILIVINSLFICTKIALNSKLCIRLYLQCILYNVYHKRECRHIKCITLLCNKCIIISNLVFNHISITIMQLVSVLSVSLHHTGAWF